MDVQPHSDLAHEHGTTRYIRSPAVPEHMALLLVAPSDLSGLLPSVAFLADLHPAQAITSLVFDYYATSALGPARWHVRVPFGSSSCRVPQFRMNVLVQEECHSSTHATSPSHHSPDGPF